MIKTRLAAALGAVAALMAAGLVGVAAPVQATDTQRQAVCGTWQMRGATGAYPAVTFAGPPEGSWVRRDTARLVKPAGEDAEQPGVEFAAFDLDLEAPEGNEMIVGVRYRLGDDTSSASGAIRMFGYKANDANTLTDAPSYGPAVAKSETGGYLVIKVPAGEKLGTLGLVYDASNNTRGSVTFSKMQAGKRPIIFTECPKPTPTATATATPQPTATATPGPSASATPEPTTRAPTGSQPDKPAETLPITGSGVAPLVGGGVAVLVGGLALVFLTRRKGMHVSG